MKTAAPIVALSARFNEASDENARAALARPARPARPGRRLDRGRHARTASELNAADFQIAPSIGLAMTLDDLRPAIENRPAGGWRGGSSRTTRANAAGFSVSVDRARRFRLMLSRNTVGADLS